jgi:hypothetical protein
MLIARKTYTKLHGRELWGGGGWGGGGFQSASKREEAGSMTLYASHVPYVCEDCCHVVIDVHDDMLLLLYNVHVQPAGSLGAS